jgi:MYND finger
MIALEDTAPRRDVVAIAITPKKKVNLQSVSTADFVSSNSVVGSGITHKSTQINSPCTVCRQLTKFTCAECKDIYYCSRECRASHYSLHRKVCTRIFKPYVYKALSRIFHNRKFRVEDFQKGPDQPLDPPDTEEYDDVQILWR